MTNDELISKYNPANAANLKPEDLEAMRALTDDQLGVLAKAFPNEPSRKTYLILYDNKLKPEKQIWQRSTWQNLFNVRKFANQKHLLPYTFLSLHNEAKLNPAQRAARQQTGGAISTSAKKVVVDLTAQQAKAELEKALDEKGTGAKKTEKAGAATATSAKKTAKPETTKKAGAAATGAAKAQTQESPADQTFDSGETE